MADDIQDLLAHNRHLNAHEPGRIPCLCKRCFDVDLETSVVDDITYTRAHAVASGRILFFWVPEDLVAQIPKIRRAVAADMRARLK